MKYPADISTGKIGSVKKKKIHPIKVYSANYHRGKYIYFKKVREFKTHN